VLTPGREGAQELEAFHTRVVNNLKFAAAIQRGGTRLKRLAKASINLVATRLNTARESAISEAALMGAGEIAAADNGLPLRLPGSTRRTAIAHEVIERYGGTWIRLSFPANTDLET